MSFIADQQTLNDLNIFSKRGNDSIYALFNRTRTRGGMDVLEALFQYPLSDAQTINDRASIIKCFQTMKMDFPFNSELFDTVEQYLTNTDSRSMLGHTENTLESKFNQFIGADSNFKQIAAGIKAISELINGMRVFSARIFPTVKETPYRPIIEEIDSIINSSELKVLTTENIEKLSFDTIAIYDKSLRFSNRDRIKKLLEYIYHIDVYLAIAGVATQRGFIFPEALSGEQQIIRLEGVYHPMLENAIGNDIYMLPGSNIIFLTGANMAGKSTFMKSLGVAIYLAHLGFPVAATKMEFTPLDGIFTSINLPDNLEMGHSHFYTEVLRVKKVAQELSLSKKLFIIFDELFRGTNVKDAYDATIAITAAFAEKQNCMFVVSTHIIEAGEKLKERCENIKFNYLPTRMEGNTPVYTYQLEEGISSDRHGMIIINNERIIETILNRKNKALS